MKILLLFAINRRCAAQQKDSMLKTKDDNSKRRCSASETIEREAKAKTERLYIAAQVNRSKDTTTTVVMYVGPRDPRPNKLSVQSARFATI